jgi:HTH-type transcriptional regulator/antitoxin HipB
MEQIARNPKQLGAILQRRRKARGLSQATLGERLAMRQATISKLEAGKPATRIETLTAALAALDLELVVRPRSRLDDPADPPP